MSRPLVALLSDFGTRDTYVASMKAGIWEIHDGINIVDLTHDIAPQDVREAAFVLRSCYQDFPRGTIFVAVVDPGVGGDRAPILVVTQDYCFVGPDNGLFSLIYRKASDYEVIRLEHSRYFRALVSSTFHGRDVFAPCAAWLSRGVQPDAFGRPLDAAPVVLDRLLPEYRKDAILGTIMHADAFGNLMVNIHKEDAIEGLGTMNPAKLSIRFQHRDLPFVSHYAQGRDGDFVGLWGSSHYLEIACPNGSAQRGLVSDDVRILLTRSASEA